MNDYSKSFQDKEKSIEATPVKLEKITTGNVKVKKKSIFSKIKNTFVGDIINDVLIPSISSAIGNTIIEGVRIVFLGGSSRDFDRRSNASRVSYRSYYDNPRESRRDSYKPRPYETGCIYDDIVFSDRGDAEDILRSLDDMIESYGNAPVSAYLELAGVSGDYTTNYYGWTNLKTARIVRVPDGFMIDFPKALPLDRM